MMMYLSVPNTVIARLVRATHFSFRTNWVARMKRAMTVWFDVVQSIPPLTP